MCKVVGILLAAGLSSRMGEDKLGLDLGGKTIGKRSFEANLASNLDYVLVVKSQPNSIPWLSGCSSEKWEEVQSGGEVQSASLISGIQRAVDLHADAAVILLADQPFISASNINQLIDHFHCDDIGPSPLFIAYRNYYRITPPVLFSKMMFKDLLILKGDHGARELIKNKKRLGSFIDSKDPISFFDIDTQEDYQMALHIINRFQQFI